METFNRQIAKGIDLFYFSYNILNVLIIFVALHCLSGMPASKTCSGSTVCKILMYFLCFAKHFHVDLFATTRCKTDVITKQTATEFTWFALAKLVSLDWCISFLSVIISKLMLHIE